MAAKIRDIPTKQSLLQALKRVNLKVPERPYSRPKESRESWVSCRLLSTLAKADRLNFPITVTLRDRPDFLIEMGGRTVGMEITEATSERFSKFSSYAETFHPDALIDLGHFRKGSPHLSNAQMLSPRSKGWFGDEPEREWAEYMKDTISKKNIRAKKAPVYQMFDENWLAIYANLPLPPIRFDVAITYLLTSIAEYLSNSAWFDTYFIEDGLKIIKITRNGIETFLLNDIWQEATGNRD